MNQEKDTHAPAPGTSVGDRIPGWLWMVACAVSFCGMGVSVKVLVTRCEVDMFLIGWLRFLAGTVLMVIPAVFGRWSLRVHNPRAFVCRGLFGATGQFLIYIVIAHVGLGRGTVLTYLMGVVGAVSGIFILHERPSRSTAVAIVAGTLGIFLTCRGGIPAGVEWLALVAALCSGVTLSFVRLLKRTDSNQVVFFGQGVFGLLILLPFIWQGRLPGTGAAWGLIVLMILCDICGQLMMSQGLGMVPVAQGAALMMLTPILSLLVGATAMGETLSSRQWIGCLTVLVSSYVATRARMRNGQNTSTTPPAAPRAEPSSADAGAEPR